MTHHVMNQMGHGVPNLIGVEPGKPRRAACASSLPGYMTMGQTRHGRDGRDGDAGAAEQHPDARRQGPARLHHMGGMFTILKVRDGLDELRRIRAGTRTRRARWPRTPPTRTWRATASRSARRGQGASEETVMHEHGKHHQAIPSHGKVDASLSVKDPVCGMTIDPGAGRRPTRARRAHVLLLQHAVPRALQGRSEPVRHPGLSLDPSGRSAGTRSIRCQGVDLPDAPADRAERAGLVPDLRHGARAAPRHRRRGSEPGARRHDPPFLGRRRADRAARAAGDVGDAPRSREACFSSRLRTWIGLVLATPVVLWGGWPFFVARRGLRPQPQPEHVHAHRARRRGRLRLQPRRHAGPGALPVRVSRP